MTHGDRHTGIELTESFRCDVEPGDDTGRLGQNDGVGLLLSVDDRLGRDIAPAEVFGERAPDQITLQASVERLEGNRLHGCGCGPPGSSEGSTETFSASPC